MLAINVASFNIVQSTKKFVDFPAANVGELGGFSFDENGDFADDRSQLRVYSPPSTQNVEKLRQRKRKPRGTADLLRSVTVEWDLMKGFETFIQKDENVTEHLDTLLKWLQLRGLLDSSSPSSAATDHNEATDTSCSKHLYY